MSRGNANVQYAQKTKSDPFVDPEGFNAALGAPIGDNSLWGQTADVKNTAEYAVADAINDQTVDDVSKREIGKMYAANSTRTDIADYVARAREGKGIFAVRKVNQNEQDIQKAMPGRQQTVSSVGYGSVI